MKNETVILSKYYQDSYGNTEVIEINIGQMSYILREYIDVWGSVREFSNVELMANGKVRFNSHRNFAYKAKRTIADIYRVFERFTFLTAGIKRNDDKIYIRASNRLYSTIFDRAARLFPDCEYIDYSRLEIFKHEDMSDITINELLIDTFSKIAKKLERIQYQYVKDLQVDIYADLTYIMCLAAMGLIRFPIKSDSPMSEMSEMVLDLVIRYRYKVK